MPNSEELASLVHWPSPTVREEKFARPTGKTKSAADLARELAKGFSTFESEDLQSLGTGEALCQIERAGFDFNLRTSMLTPLDDAAAAEKRRGVIVERSRQTYAVPREAVEALLRGSHDAITVAAVFAFRNAKTSWGATSALEMLRHQIGTDRCR